MIKSQKTEPRSPRLFYRLTMQEIMTELRAKVRTRVGPNHSLRAEAEPQNNAQHHSVHPIIHISADSDQDLKVPLHGHTLSKNVTTIITE